MEAHPNGLAPRARRLWPGLGALLLAALLVVTSCQAPRFSPPPPRTLFQPASASVAELTAAYAQNPAAAAARYEGGRYYFGVVTVARVFSTGFPRRDLEDALLVENLKFKPRYPGEIASLTDGMAVEVAGTVTGMQWGYIVVADCWVKAAGGSGTLPAAY